MKKNSRRLYLTRTTTLKLGEDLFANRRLRRFRRWAMSGGAIFLLLSFTGALGSARQPEPLETEPLLAGASRSIISVPIAARPSAVEQIQPVMPSETTTIQVRSESLLRKNTLIEFRAQFSEADLKQERFRVLIDEVTLQGMEVDEVIPAPIAVTSEEGKTSYAFAIIPGATGAEVLFHLAPRVRGKVVANMGREGPRYLTRFGLRVVN